MSYKHKVFYQEGLPYVCSDVSDQYNTADYYENGQNVSYKIVAQTAQTKYARWVMWFVIVVVFLRLVYRTWYKLIDRFEKTRKYRLPFQFVALCRFLGYKRVPYFPDMPVSVGNITLITSFLLFFSCVLFVPHPWYRACLQFDNPPLSVRAALMSNCLIPFIFAFAGKSTIVSWLTGVSYEKLNVYHRMLAYLCLVTAAIHLITIVYRAQVEGGTHFVHYVFWVRNGSMPMNGAVAFVLLCFLCFFSVKWVRAQFYELFIICHWPVALAFFGVMYWHSGGVYESWAYCWGALGIMLSGWLYRWLGKSSYMRLNENWLWSDKAVVRMSAGGEVQLSVFSYVSRLWKPGQHVFLRFTTLQPFSNHPFSICSIPETATARNGVAEMKFLINPQSGLTKRLAERASSTGSPEFNVLIDGPFGGVDRDINSFDSAILVASGSGISAVVPFISHYAYYKRTDMSSIHLLWVVRHSSKLEWAIKELESAKATLPNNLHIYIHLSREDTETLPDSTQESLSSLESIEKNIKVTEKSQAFTIERGRPNIESYMNEWAPMLGSRTLVFSCGVDEILRKTANSTSKLQTKILRGDRNSAGELYREIYLHSEVFDW